MAGQHEGQCVPSVTTFSLLTIHRGVLKQFRERRHLLDLITLSEYPLAKSNTAIRTLVMSCPQARGVSGTARIRDLVGQLLPTETLEVFKVVAVSD